MTPSGHVIPRFTYPSNRRWAVLLYMWSWLYPAITSAHGEPNLFQKGTFYMVCISNSSSCCCSCSCCCIICYCCCVSVTVNVVLFICLDVYECDRLVELKENGCNDIHYFNLCKCNWCVEIKGNCRMKRFFFPMYCFRDCLFCFLFSFSVQYTISRLIIIPEVLCSYFQTNLQIWLFCTSWKGWLLRFFQLLFHKPCIILLIYTHKR